MDGFPLPTLPITDGCWVDSQPLYAFACRFAVVHTLPAFPRCRCAFDCVHYMRLCPSSDVYAYGRRLRRLLPLPVRLRTTHTRPPPHLRCIAAPLPIWIYDSHDTDCGCSGAVVRLLDLVLRLLFARVYVYIGEPYHYTTPFRLPSPPVTTLYDVDLHTVTMGVDTGRWITVVVVCCVTFPPG